MRSTEKWLLRGIQLTYLRKIFGFSEAKEVGGW